MVRGLLGLTDGCRKAHIFQIEQIRPIGTNGAWRSTTMAKKEKEPKPLRPKQQQSRRPGLESKMTPRPRASDATYKACGKLKGKVALITGGDSGIGRAVAIVFAKEGADVSCLYLNEHDDAKETKRLVEAEGRKCLLIAGDIGDESFCRKSVEQAVKELGRLDCLINNAAE